MSNLKAALAIAIALTTTLTVCPSGHGQARELNSVLSVVADASGKFLVINTSLPRPLGAPVIQYFPGPDGNTVMVADFFGVVFHRPSGVINHPSNDPRIKQIRFGQFQENPPTFRISITTNNPNYLRQLTFKSTPGSLIVKWPSSSMPPLAPTNTLRTQVKEIAVAPPIGTSFGRGSSLASASLPPLRAPVTNQSILTAPVVVKTTSAPVIKPVVPAMKQLLPLVAQKPMSTPIPTQSAPKPVPKAIAEKPLAEMPNPITAPIKASTPAAFSPVSNTARRLLFTSLSRLRDLDSNGNLPAAPVETIISQNSAVIKLHTNPSLVYRAFRLHDPERYVLDIDGMPELLTTESPSLESNPFLNSIRVGAPSSGENLARVVLDLTNANLIVKEKLSNGENLLTLTVSCKQNLIDDLAVAPNTKVVLDAGHGGSDPGAQRASIQEKELTLSITEKLRSVLLSKGIKVEMTRSDDTFVSLEDRVKLTNASKPNAFVSVHINSLETSSNIQGIETYYQTEQSRSLADLIHQSLVGGLQVPDRSVRKARFYVINHTEVPAILAEVGYITNKDERDKLISADYQNQIAEAIARGVILYLNKHYQANAAADEKAGRIN